MVGSLLIVGSSHEGFRLASYPSLFHTGGEMEEKTRQRIGVWIDPSVNQRFDAIVPHGMKSEVIRILMEVLTDALEVHGEELLGFILTKKIKIVIAGVEAQSGQA